MNPSIHQFTVKDIKGNPVSLEQYKGKVLLIVNTASKCGFTPQLNGMKELYDEFKGEDLLLIITQKGYAKTIFPELTAHFDEDMIVLEKWNPNKPISAIYYDGEKERYYVKRFLIESENREDLFISEHPKWLHFNHLVFPNL